MNVIEVTDCSLRSLSEYLSKECFQDESKVMAMMDWTLFHVLRGGLVGIVRAILDAQICHRRKSTWETVRTSVQLHSGTDECSCSLLGVVNPERSGELCPISLQAASWILNQVHIPLFELNVSQHGQSILGVRWTSGDRKGIGWRSLLTISLLPAVSMIRWLQWLDVLPYLAAWKYWVSWRFPQMCYKSNLLQFEDSDNHHGNTAFHFLSWSNGTNFRGLQVYIFQLCYSVIF